MPLSGATTDTRRAFSGGRILTMDPVLGEPDVLIVEGGRIAATGDRALLDAHPGVPVEPLAGRTLVPGLIDAHNHLSIAALHPRWADMSAATSLDDVRDALAAQAVREPTVPWLRASGWNEATGLLLDRGMLDALGFDRPVIVVHYSLHQCVVSSAGADALGIGRTTPDPPGGMIVRGLDGQPSGLLVERAWSEAHARSLAGYADPDRWGELIVARAQVLLRDGITGVHDAACAPSAEAVYRALRHAGRLPISVLMMPHAEAILTDPPAARLDGPTTGTGDEWLRTGPVKFFADGGIAPAMDVSIGGVRSAFGIVMPGLVEGVREAVRRGFRVAVHAIGNVGVRNALDAFRRAARVRDGDHRFRIEHACLVSPGQLPEMASLGAIAVVQPGFLHHVGPSIEHVPWDEERWFAFADMLAAGVPIAGSSDDPCAPHEPLRGAACGATRRTGSGGVFAPEQAVGFEEWLRRYTIGAAYAGGQEHERGTLTPGKRADLVVLDGPLDPEHPPRVAETWVAGTLVHRRDAE